MPRHAKLLVLIRVQVSELQAAPPSQGGLILSFFRFGSLEGSGSNLPTWLGGLCFVLFFVCFSFSICFSISFSFSFSSYHLFHFNFSFLFLFTFLSISVSFCLPFFSISLSICLFLQSFRLAFLFPVPCPFFSFHFLVSFSSSLFFDMFHSFPMRFLFPCV